MPPSGRRNSTLPPPRATLCGSRAASTNASPSSASAGLAVDASARPGAVLITPSSGSPTTVVALALPQPSIRWLSVDMRRRSLCGSSTGAQVAKMARRRTRYGSPSPAPRAGRRRRAADRHCRETSTGNSRRRPSSASPLARSPPTRSRRATGCGRWPRTAASSTNGRGSSGPMFMSTRRISCCHRNPRAGRPASRRPRRRSARGSAARADTPPSAS